MKKLNAKGFGALEVLLVVVIIGMICGVGYYVYSAQKKTNIKLDNAAKSQSEPQKSENKDKNSQVSTSPQSETISPLLVAGQVDFNIDNKRGQTGVVYIESYAVTDSMTEIWLEYGKTVDNLSQQTDHISRELGLGEAGTFGNFTHVIQTNKLDPGINYFYRVAAKTKDGKTLHSGMAAFTSRK